MHHYYQLSGGPDALSGGPDASLIKKSFLTLILMSVRKRFFNDASGPPDNPIKC